MGRECGLTRWFKGLFGIKRGSNSSSGRGRELGSFICHNPATVPPNISPAEAVWLISHSISAGKASPAVVKLTSHGGAAGLAAVTIQTVFRGFLARKALRALKGLVKIQALVRGFLVRKQATETLQSMEALMRAQATVRCRKIRARMSPEHFGSIRLKNASISDFGDDPLFRKATSPLPILRPPRRAPSPDCRSFQEAERFFSGEDCRFSTAQNTPRSNIPATPPRSVAGESLFRRHVDFHFPNYMADTTSFRAKLRSYSAPKQRPEPKKETMESRSLRIRRSQVGEAISFKNAVMGKLDRSGSDYGIVRDIVRGSPGYVHNI